MYYYFGHMSRDVYIQRIYHIQNTVTKLALIKTIFKGKYNREDFNFFSKT